MKRYGLGVIQPVWRAAVGGRPVVVSASDRRGFGVLDSGQVRIYRLADVLDGMSEGMKLASTTQSGSSTVYALGPGGWMFAAPHGMVIQVEEEGKGPIAALPVAGDTISGLAFSASGKTLWGLVERDSEEGAQLYAWDVATYREEGHVDVLGPDGSVYELVVHPELERVGVDAAAGQEGSSFTFVERERAGLTVLAGSHDGDDGVSLGGLFAEGALLITQEATVMIDVHQADRTAGPSRATLSWMKDEMIFDYQRGYIDGYWVLSGRFDSREENEHRAVEDTPEGRLRVYDTNLKEVLEMPSTDEEYDTPWAVVGLVGQRVMICQSDALMLYELRGYLA